MAHKGKRFVNPYDLLGSASGSASEDSDAEVDDIVDILDESSEES